MIHHSPQERAGPTTGALKEKIIAYRRAWLRLVLLTAAVAAVAAVAASPTMPLAAKAMYSPDLFQGDIKGVAGQEPGRERAGILGAAYLWPRGEVPYVIGDFFSKS
ncbi:Astacin [Chionoecetes opilio]|uniref:Astacin n=1 Tax=Chionoecetes opilio TaxID=41210 RepID=A0A8J4Y442_CHIOP|nr:Astacin [Chionoecetes opilio]